MSKFGDFSADGSEYVVRRTDTPRPWYNRFGNAQHAVVTSHTAGGYAIAGDRHRFQLTWYTPRIDQAGRYIYLRDEANGAFWSASWAPVKAPLDSFECRHGQAWSTFSSRKDGIECEYTVFVPLKGPVEIWHAKVKNLSRRTRRIAAFPFVEWTIDDGPQSVDDLVYAAYSEAWYEPGNHAVIAARRDTDAYRFHHGFMMADFVPNGWEANRDAFVGAGGDLARPAAIAQGRLSGTPAEAEVSVGALATRLTLAPGETRTFNVLIGMAQTRAERQRLRRSFLMPGAPERALEEVRAFWEAMPERFAIRTPDKGLDRYINRCLVRHVYTHGASNATRPIRIQLRNQVQDILGITLLEPARARRLLGKMMRWHCASGDALQWFGMGAPYAQGPEHVDTKLWLVYSTCAYIRETGDFSILNHREPLFDAKEPVALRGVIDRALDKSWKDRGAHGLSLIGRGDWNDNLDGMGREGRGESVWMSMALYWALTQTAEMARTEDFTAKAQVLEKRARQLRAAIHIHGWDGAWYRMGYTDHARPVGTRHTREGRIFLMPQVWAVLSGVATPEQTRRIFDTIDRRLSTPYGPRLNEKPFTKPDPSIGRVTFLAQGMSENGPIYMHSGAFKLCADGLAGRGDELYGDLVRLLPCFHDPAVILGEPFVLPNFYRPPEVPRKYGATHRSWVTTAPAWMLLAVSEGMMGVRTTYDGIKCDPTLPRKWKKAFIRRRIRGATYEIDIRNASGRGHGVQEVQLDGRIVKGAVIPFATDGATHKVVVVV